MKVCASFSDTVSQVFWLLKGWQCVPDIDPTVFQVLGKFFGFEGQGMLGSMACVLGAFIEMENRQRGMCTRTKGAVLGKFFGLQDRGYWDPGVLGAFGRNGELVAACAHTDQRSDAWEVLWVLGQELSGSRCVGCVWSELRICQRGMRTQTTGAVFGKFFRLWGRGYWDPGVLGAFGRNGESVAACAHTDQRSDVWEVLWVSGRELFGSRCVGCVWSACRIGHRGMRAQTKGVVLGKFFSSPRPFGSDRGSGRCVTHNSRPGAPGVGVAGLVGVQGHHGP